MRAAAAIVCALALVAGCGDDDDETTVVETTTVTTTDAAPPPPEPDPTTPADPNADAPEDADGDGAAEAPGECGTVAFAPNTDSGAFNIAAVGTDCRTARAVARAARNSTDELSYEAHGFRCSGARSDEPGLSSVEWFCIGAGREVVTFATS